LKSKRVAGLAALWIKKDPSEEKESPMFMVTPWGGMVEVKEV